MPQLLLELFSEEIPARMQAQAAEDLQRLMAKALKERGLEGGDARAFVTPRRLTLVVENLPAASADVSEELKGPRTSAPAAALDGFLKKTGLAKDQLSVQADPKGDFYVAKIARPGRAAASIIAEAVTETVRSFPWPKSMKWEPSGLQWVRPLRGVLCLFDGAVVPFEIAGLAAGDETRGHRQMANEPFAVKDFADYEAKLRERRVVLARDERMRIIAEQAQAAAEKAQLVFRDDPALLEEVAGLVEWPVVLTGRFEGAFLAVPQEVLISTMRANQKYFALTEAGGKLANSFLVVCNLEARDGGGAIVAGNERVIRARLADAKFFWEQDLKETLEERLPRLEEIVFHARLGTQWDRVQRIESLAGAIAERIGADRPEARRAARLCKADLVSGTVGEFPEVQGIIGGYLARAEGLGDAVADAIADHYRPQGPSDRVPTGPVSVAVALADKLDILAGFFAIDEKPTGSKDPFALRRAALGVVRLVLEGQLRVTLNRVILDHFVPVLIDIGNVAADARIRALVAARDAGVIDDKEEQALGEREFHRRISHEARQAAWKTAEAAAGNLHDFFGDRLKVALRERGIRHDIVESLFAQVERPSIEIAVDDSFGLRLGSKHADTLDLVLLVRRVEALQAFLTTDDGKKFLLAGYKRAANILRIEEKKDKRAHDGAVDAGKLTAPEEKTLFAAIEDAAPRIESAIGTEEFAEAMAELASLRAPVDAFFDKVTVNDADPTLRANRLNLLARIKSAAHLVADFSKIEG